MPRKTPSTARSCTSQGTSFNEAAARCRGKLREVVEVLRQPVLLQ